jgi:hypothetical protein
MDNILVTAGMWFSPGRNVSKLPSVDILVMANVDIHAIVLTIENYENRTVTPISISNNSPVNGY